MTATEDEHAANGNAHVHADGSHEEHLVPCLTLIPHRHTKAGRQPRRPWAPPAPGSRPRAWQLHLACMGPAPVRCVRR